MACGRLLASKGHYKARFRSLFGERTNKKQQMRWNTAIVQPFLDVHTAMLSDTLEDVFRHRHSGFRSTNDDQVMPAAG